MYSYIVFLHSRPIYSILQYTYICIAELKAYQHEVVENVFVSWTGDWIHKYGSRE